MSTRTLVEGTSGADTIDLSGTTEPHLIQAHDGNDTIFAGDGGDIIDTGGGHDAVWGGSGGDTIIAGGGINQYHGGGGADLLRGSDADDFIRILSFSGLESIDGGAGSDTLAGGNSNDYWDFTGIVVTGLELIDLGAGWNRFTGSAGDDRITAGHKNDVIDGGGGFNEFLYGGRYADYSLALSAGTITVQGLDGKDTLTNIQRITFADGYWEGGTFTAGDGGGDGGGTVNTAPVAQDDTVTTTAGVAIAFDPLGNDSDPDGDALAVTAMGTAGNGTVALADGQWTYTPDDGFSGTDSFTYTVSDGDLSDSATVTVTVEPDAGSGGGNPPSGGDYVLLEGTGGADLLDVSGDTRPHRILGLDGNDTLNGGAAGDILDGGGGHNTMDGGAGDDVILGGSGYNRYHGGSGIDTLRGTDGDDMIRIYAMTGIEVIAGGAGNDTLYTGNSSDTLDLSDITVTGIELIDLGSGWNRFTGSSGDDRITAGTKDDIIDGGGGVNTMVYGGAYADYTVVQGSGGITVSGIDGRDSLSNVQRLAFSDGSWENGQFTPTGGTPVNRAPVAQDDSIATSEGQAVAFNPLSNDSDPDGDTITVVAMGQPAHGSVSQGTGGQWTYTPAAGFSGTDSFAYTIGDGSLEDGATVTVSVAPATSGGGDGGGGTGGGAVISQALWDKLSAITEGGWGRLNDNSFAAVAPAPSDAASYGTPMSVIQAWSSMAWDSNRNDLIFWGGGHANYSGNEVYRFDTDTLTWERASLPSRVTDTAHPAVFETVDGPAHSPISSHTYDNNEFLPVADRFITFGGAAYGSGSNFVEVDGFGGTTPTGPYLWNPALADPDKVGGLDGTGMDPSRGGGRMWENRDGVYQDGINPGSFINGATAYAEIDGKDVIYISNSHLWKYTIHDPADPSQDTIEKVGKKWDPFNGAGTGVYDSENNLFVRSANGTFTYWDLDTAGTGNRNVVFTPTDLSGGFTMNARMAMDYDAGRGRILLWRGSDDVWELDAPDVIGSNGWTVRKLPDVAAGPGGEPDIDTYNQTEGTSGILGKWKYIDDLDIFLGVYDHTDGNVWAYKPTDWNPDITLA